MLKYMIGIVVFAIVAVGAYYVWDLVKQAPVQEEQTPLSPMQPATTTYATTTFSIMYPQTFTLNEFYKYEGFPKKPIDGVSLTVPLGMATGTNLSSDSYLAVEWLPRAKSCTGDI